MVAGMVTGAVAAAVLAAGGGAGHAADSSYWMRAEARFAPPAALVPSSAITYDMGLVPAASSIAVSQRGSDSGMTVSMRVRGLVPGHAYGAHVHTGACGADPEDAGGHYQNIVDPDRENAENEVWLDFTADANGDGAARVHKAWGLRSGEARSVVVHDEPGGSGDRVACFTVPFVAQP
ncbi:superoxide dismutase family protein [Streptomyces sp. WG-D5]